MYNDYRQVSKEQIIQWQEQGLNDEQMAKLCNSSKPTFGRHRRKLNIPTKFIGGQNSLIIEHPILTKDFLNSEFFIKNKSLSQISKEVKISIGDIKYWANKYDLTVRTIQERLSSQFPELTAFQLSIIRGSLLGDAYGKTNTSGSSYIRFAHCIAQKNYLMHKANLLSPFISNNISYTNSPVEYKDEIREEYYSCSKYTHFLKEFTPIIQEFYPEGKKIIPLNIEEWLDWVSLAFWFGDDGFSGEEGLKIIYGLFDKESIERSEKAFKKLGLGYEINDRGEFPIVVFTKGSSKEIEYRCKEFLPKCIHYKFKHVSNHIEERNKTNKRRSINILSKHSEISIEDIKNLNKHQIAEKYNIKVTNSWMIKNYYEKTSFKPLSIEEKIKLFEDIKSNKKMDLKDFYESYQINDSNNVFIIRDILNKFIFKIDKVLEAGTNYLLPVASLGLRYTGISSDKDIIMSNRQVIKELNLKDCRIVDGEVEDVLEAMMNKKYDLVFSNVNHFNIYNLVVDAGILVSTLKEFNKFEYIETVDNFNIFRRIK